MRKYLRVVHLRLERGSQGKAVRRIFGNSSWNYFKTRNTVQDSLNGRIERRVRLVILDSILTHWMEYWTYTVYFSIIFRDLQIGWLEGRVSTLGSSQEQTWHELRDYGSSSEILLSKRNPGQSGWTATSVSICGRSSSNESRDDERRRPWPTTTTQVLDRLVNASSDLRTSRILKANEVCYSRRRILNCNNL